jgi:hypothetical protein
MNTQSWQPIGTAPQDGTPILLLLDPPVNTNDMIGWCREMHLPVVIGWWSISGTWECGLCEEGSADTEGYSVPLQITVSPTRWMPVPTA